MSKKSRQSPQPGESSRREEVNSKCTVRTTTNEILHSDTNIMSKNSGSSSSNDEDDEDNNNSMLHQSTYHPGLTADNTGFGRKKKSTA